jgi:hypothetical protein
MKITLPLIFALMLFGCSRPERVNSEIVVEKFENEYFGGKRFTFDFPVTQMTEALNAARAKCEIDISSHVGAKFKFIGARATPDRAKVILVFTLVADSNGRGLKDVVLAYDCDASSGTLVSKFYVPMD